ncbi:MAG TPA: gamma-glutamyltransferase family protein [Nannocystis sp.]
MLGFALVIAGCFEPDVPDFIDADETDAVEFRDHIRDAYLPTPVTVNKRGPDPAYEGGVVTTTEPLAAEIGRSILAAGGNAVDAAVAVQFALNVCEPQSSGVGGGGVMLIRKKGQGPEKTILIDFRENAPKASTLSMYDTSHATSVKDSSGYSVGVPGTVKGMEYAHAHYGSGKPGFAWADLLAPAIFYAENGINISARLAADTGSSQLTLEPTANSTNRGAYAEARKVYRPNGSSLPSGYKLVQPDLAKTLREIAEHGSAAIYDCASPIAAAIIETQKATRTSNPGGAGRMTCADDLAKYKVRVYDPDGEKTSVPPLFGKFHDYTLVTPPPPASGFVVLQMLDLIEDLEARHKFTVGAGNYKFGDFLTLNIMLEVMRLSFADRARWLGDPAFYPVPTGGLLDPGYIHARAGLITPGKRYGSTIAGGNPPAVLQQQAQDIAPEVKPGKPNPPGKSKKLDETPGGIDTTHFTIIDGEGTTVSVTSTLSSTWGSGLMVKNYGFMLNNQLRNFNDKPVGNSQNPGPNDVQGYKRPRTTLSPTLVFLGDKLVAAYGSPGDSGILTAIFQVTLNLISHGMSLQSSVSAPRISVTSGGASAVVDYEPGFSSSVRSKLAGLGYDLDGTSAIGAVQAIVTYPYTNSYADDKQYGAADARRIGGVAGVDK